MKNNPGFIYSEANHPGDFDDLCDVILSFPAGKLFCMSKRTFPANVRLKWGIFMHAFACDAPPTDQMRYRLLELKFLTSHPRPGHIEIFETYNVSPKHSVRFCARDDVLYLEP